MEDSQIVALFFSRSEKAISAAAEKYEKYCRSIAFGILNDDTESEECVNDVFLKAWESIPPKKPSNLSGYLAKLTRNHAINWVKCRNAVKRGSGQITLALEELEECIERKRLLSDGAISLCRTAVCFHVGSDELRIVVQDY